MPLERMLRIYFMQQWFNLSDPQAEDSLYDIEPMRRFAGIELADDAPFPTKPRYCTSGICSKHTSSPSRSLPRCARCWRKRSCC